MRQDFPRIRPWSVSRRRSRQSRKGLEVEFRVGESWYLFPKPWRVRSNQSQNKPFVADSHIWFGTPVIPKKNLNHRIHGCLVYFQSHGSYVFPPTFPTLIFSNSKVPRSDPPRRQSPNSRHQRQIPPWPRGQKQQNLKKWWDFSTCRIIPRLVQEGAPWPVIRWL